MEMDTLMQNLRRGLLAGLIATIVLSALMVANSAFEVMPAPDFPMMIADMMGKPDMPFIGWGVHFSVGVVGYGATMALLDARLPCDSHVVHGVILGFVGWVIMMVVVMLLLLLMPMFGAILVAMSLNTLNPVMTLALHLIFGAVLGWVYSWPFQVEASMPAARAH